MTNRSTAKFVNALFNKGIPYLFVTNNSSKQPEDFLSLLQSYNNQAKERDIFTSSMATASYIKQHHAEASCIVLGAKMD